jgi:hypothetical protein
MGFPGPRPFSPFGAGFSYCWTKKKAPAGAPRIAYADLAEQGRLGHRCRRRHRAQCTRTSDPKQDVSNAPRPARTASRAGAPGDGAARYPQEHTRPLGGYELAREQRRITADAILRAAGTADETDRMPVPQFGLLNSVVMPAVERAERAFSTALARINIEDLAHSAAALPSQEPDRADSILTEPDSVRQSR